jgi:hypothetical protein
VLHSIRAADSPGGLLAAVTEGNIQRNRKHSELQVKTHREGTNVQGHGAVDHCPPATFEGKWIARTNRVAADDFQKDVAEDVELGITTREPDATCWGAPSGTVDFNG